MDHSVVLRRQTSEPYLSFACHALVRLHAFDLAKVETFPVGSFDLKQQLLQCPPLHLHSSSSYPVQTWHCVQRPTELSAGWRDSTTQ